jgi:hypothetical protein
MAELSWLHVLTAFRDCQGARIKASAPGAQALSETLGVPVTHWASKMDAFRFLSIPLPLLRVPSFSLPHLETHAALRTTINPSRYLAHSHASFCHARRTCRITGRIRSSILTQDWRKVPAQPWGCQQRVPGVHSCDAAAVFHRHACLYV